MANVTHCRYCQRQVVTMHKGPKRKVCTRAECQRAANRERQRRHREKAKVA